MKMLLAVTAVLEIAAGLAFACVPSTIVLLLLGVPLDGPAAMTIGRLAGAALLSLGLACWIARGDASSGAARGVVAGMLLYNLTAVALFLFARIGLNLAGIALWPGAVVHGAMAAWCMKGLSRE